MNSVSSMPRLYIGRQLGFNKAFVKLINDKMNRPDRVMLRFDEEKHRLMIRFYDKKSAAKLGSQTFAVIHMNNRLMINLTEKRRAYIEKLITVKDPHYDADLQHDKDGYYVEINL